jgi:hemerythrin
MDFILWCDLFKIGHPIIDEQHQKLFKIANKFHSDLQKREKELLISDTLNNLVKYVEFHFDEEIKIFQKKDYPDFEIIKHNDIHENIVKDIFKLNERFSQGKYDSIVEVERFIADWIVLHILQEDMKFKYHLKNR